MMHSKNCPLPRGGECTCGGMSPVPPGLTVDGPIDLSHSGLCPAAMGAAGPCTCEAGASQPEVTVDGGTVTVQKPGWYQMTVGAQSTADAPKDTDDHPYRDVERSRDLAARAEEAALEGKDDLAHFLLQLAGEARLLAELQGRWEY